MDIKLYEYAPTRSARCHWTLLEADLEFESIDRGMELIRSPELRQVHPLGKLPAALIDGKPLFESAAICTYIADQVPDKQLISPSGTWERALHDQWSYFCLSELEAWLWSSAQNTFVLPEEERVPAVLEQNAKLFRGSASVVDAALREADYLVANRFSVTDIIMSFALNWAGKQGLLDGFGNIEAYLGRLYERPHCTLSRD